MFGVFIGEHDNKVDGKGRVSIPADFRRVLEEADPKWEAGRNPSMVIVYGGEKRNYLEIFTIADMKALSAKIARMPRGSRKRADLQQLYFSQAQVTTVDDTGRIVLSGKMRTKLGIGEAAKVVGNGETFLIWKPETYEIDGMAGLREEDDYDPEADPSIYLPGDEIAGGL